jgi:hypothetical protein
MTRTRAAAVLRLRLRSLRPRAAAATIRRLRWWRLRWTALCLSQTKNCPTTTATTSKTLYSRFILPIHVAGIVKASLSDLLLYVMINLVICETMSGVPMSPGVVGQ